MISIRTIHPFSLPLTLLILFFITFQIHEKNSITFAKSSRSSSRSSSSFSRSSSSSSRYSGGSGSSSRRTGGSSSDGSAGNSHSPSTSAGNGAGGGGKFTKIKKVLPKIAAGAAKNLPKILKGVKKLAKKFRGNKAENKSSSESYEYVDEGEQNTNSTGEESGGQQKNDIWSTGVRGMLLCEGKPAVGVLVKLYDQDYGLNLDDLLDKSYTDGSGNFTLKGNSIEKTPIEPKLNVYHDCIDDFMPCQRKFSIMLPNSSVFAGEQPARLFDVGTIELSAKFTGEERDCFHRR